MHRQRSLKLHFERLRAAVSPTHKTLAELRAAWAGAGAKDGWLASRYFDLTRASSAASTVDDKTWADLELPSIFSNLDTTMTPLGSQVLFKKLRTYVDEPDALHREYVDCGRLRFDKPLREAIQLKLSYLRDDSCAAIADYVFGQPPVKPRHHALVPIWSLVSVGMLLAVIVLSLTPWLWFAVVLVNIVVIHLVSPQLHRDTSTLRACNRMLRAADGLSMVTTTAPSLPWLERLADAAFERTEARKELLWFSISQHTTIVMILSVWLNLAFLAEQVAYLRTIDRFARFRPALASTFEVLGSLDAAIAVASFLERCPHHCEPVVVDDARIEIEHGRHPLLAQPVDNSIRLDRKSALITGSNMAGKTTFIKMISINVIFGRTLGICLATSAVIPRSGVMASIRGEHSVESGKSHYFAETEAILAFIENARAGRCRVFVIDELFSGTNTVERVAAARAVLGAISTNAQVLITTHDVELQALLGDRFELYHFQEDPEVKGFFDFRLRPGATRERNAIRLLERMGFPDAIVREALAFVAETERRAADRDT